VAKAKSATHGPLPRPPPEPSILRVEFSFPQLLEVLHALGLSGQIEKRLKKVERIVTKLTDSLDEFEAELDQEIARVNTSTDAFNARIAELQAQVDAGGATQAVIDQLDRMKAKAAAVNPKLPDVIDDVPAT
jgi:chromosome segregation ATPase